MTEFGKDRAAVVPAKAGTPFPPSKTGSPPPTKAFGGDVPARKRRPSALLPSALLKYLPLLLLAAIWQGVVQLGLVSHDLLPSLTDVLKAGWMLVREGDLWQNGAASLYRGVAGLALAIAVGGALGIAMAWWRGIDAFLGPLVEALYPLPKSALIPVTVLWLGFGDGSKTLLIFLGCMIPVTLGAYNGARSCEQALVWSARSLGSGRLRVLWDVVVPSALPELLNGVRTALALSFVLLVSSELIVSRSGLGYLIGFLGEGGVYDAMFAVVLVVAFAGFFADRLYLLLVRRVLAWRE